MADVIVEFGAKIDALNRGVDSVKSKLEEVHTTTKANAEGFVTLQRVIEFAFSGAVIAGIEQFIVRVSELGDRTERTMAILGTTAEQTLRLSAMARLSGTTMDAMAMGMERLYRNALRSNRDAFGPAAEAMRVLGLRASDLTKANGDAATMIEVMHGAVSRFNPSMNLFAAVEALAGRQVAQMLPLLTQSGEKWDEVKKRIDSAQAGMAAAIPGMAETNTKIQLMELSLAALATRIFSVFKPAIDFVIEKIQAMADSMEPETIRLAAQNISNWLIDFAVAVGKFFIELKRLIKEAALEVDSFFAKLATVAGAAAAGGLIFGPVGAAVGAIGGAAAAAGLGVGEGKNLEKEIETLRIEAQAAKDTLDGMAKSGKEAVSEAFGDPAQWSGVARSITTISNDVAMLGQRFLKANAAAMDFTRSAGFSAMQKQITAEIAMRDLQYRILKDRYTADVAAYGMSESEKISLLNSKLLEMQAANDAAYDKLMLTYAKDAAQYQAYLEAKRKKSAEIDLLIQRNNEELYRSLQKEVEGYIGTIQSSFNSSLRGLLAGTTSFSEASKKIFADLIIYMIEQLMRKFVFEKAILLVTKALYAEEVATKVVVEGAKTGATVAGATARASAETVGSGVAVAGYISDAISAIAASVGKIFAQMTAWLTPIFGPFAPAAALGIAAGVGATAVALISRAETGTNYIARSGLASVHKGEAIVPAQFNTPFTAAGMGSAAPPVTVNVTNNGPMSTHQLNQQARQIAKAVADAWRFNPSLRPQY